jgi:hypothetical protein
MRKDNTMKDTIIFPEEFKFEQIAIHVPNIEKAIDEYKRLGIVDWNFDEVTAHGTVFGKNVDCSIGQLAFNYDFGYEFELLHYKKGNNWHKARGRNLNKPFLSHKAYHVDDIEAEKEKFKSMGIEICQELWTDNHSSPYLIEKARKYHYVIFDTFYEFGYDIKLIQRIGGS